MLLQSTNDMGMTCHVISMKLLLHIILKLESENFKNLADISVLGKPIIPVDLIKRFDMIFQ